MKQNSGGHAVSSDNFLWDHQRFLETIARYELVRLAEALPGSIAQVGVGQGFGLVTMAKIHDLISPYRTQCEFWGFDTFTFYENADPDEIEILTRFARGGAQRVYREPPRTGRSRDIHVFQNSPIQRSSK